MRWPFPFLRRLGFFPASCRVANRRRPNRRLGQRRTPIQTWKSHRPTAAQRCPPSCRLHEPRPTVRPTFPIELPQYFGPFAPSHDEEHSALVLAWAFSVPYTQAIKQSPPYPPRTSTVKAEISLASQLCQPPWLRYQATSKPRLRIATCSCHQESSNHQSTWALNTNVFRNPESPRPLAVLIVVS